MIVSQEALYASGCIGIGIGIIAGSVPVAIGVSLLVLGGTIAVKAILNYLDGKA